MMECIKQLYSIELYSIFQKYLCKLVYPIYLEKLRFCNYMKFDRYYRNMKARNQLFQRNHKTCCFLWLGCHQHKVSCKDNNVQPGIGSHGYNVHICREISLVCSQFLHQNQFPHQDQLFHFYLQGAWQPVVRMFNDIGC